MAPRMKYVKSGRFGPLKDPLDVLLRVPRPHEYSVFSPSSTVNSVFAVPPDQPNGSVGWDDAGWRAQFEFNLEDGGAPELSTESERNRIDGLGTSDINSELFEQRFVGDRDRRSGIDDAEKRSTLVGNVQRNKRPPYRATVWQRWLAEVAMFVGPTGQRATLIRDRRRGARQRPEHARL
jgi:hypothetical protein